MGGGLGFNRTQYVTVRPQRSTAEHREPLSIAARATRDPVENLFADPTLRAQSQGARQVLCEGKPLVGHVCGVWISTPALYPGHGLRQGEAGVPCILCGTSGSTRGSCRNLRGTWPSMTPSFRCKSSSRDSERVHSFRAVFQEHVEVEGCSRGGLRWKKVPDGNAVQSRKDSGSRDQVGTMAATVPARWYDHVGSSRQS